MSKILLILSLIGLLAVVSLACQTAGLVDAEGEPPRPPSSINSPEVSMVSLPEDSEFVGTFVAERSRQGDPWTDSGEFTEKEYKRALLGVRCGTRWLVKLTLSAMPGYTWIYHSEEGMRKEGWYLEETK